MWILRKSLRKSGGFKGDRLSCITMATPTMTMTRFAVFATEEVTAFVFLMVKVAT